MFSLALGDYFHRVKKAWKWVFVNLFWAASIVQFWKDSTKQLGNQKLAIEFFLLIWINLKLAPPISMRKGNSKKFSFSQNIQENRSRYFNFNFISIWTAKSQGHMIFLFCSKDKLLAKNAQIQFNYVSCSWLQVINLTRSNYFEITNFNFTTKMALRLKNDRELVAWSY